MKLDLFQDANGKWRMHLTARNGQIWMSGESYSTKGNARRAARSFVKSAQAGITIHEA